MIQSDGVVVIRRLFRTTPERLFRAWTDPDQIGRWWQNMDSAELEPRPGGKRIYHYSNRNGTKHSSIGKFIEVVPPKLLIFTWTPMNASKETEVRLEFIARGPQLTELSLTHSGIESEDTRVDHHDGWSFALDWLLKEFPYSPSLEEAKAIRFSKRFSKSAEEISRAWTDAEIFKTWFQPTRKGRLETVSYVDFDSQENGWLRFDLDSSGDRSVFLGQFERFEPGHKLIFSLYSDWIRYQTRVRIDLIPDGNGCRLDFSQTPLANEAEAALFQEAWESTLARLQ